MNFVIRESHPERTDALSLLPNGNNYLSWEWHVSCRIDVSRLRNVSCHFFLTSSGLDENGKYVFMLLLNPLPSTRGHWHSITALSGGWSEGGGSGLKNPFLLKFSGNQYQSIGIGMKHKTISYLWVKPVELTCLWFPCLQPSLMGIVQELFVPL